jgi:hypothetical protein
VLAATLAVRDRPGATPRWCALGLCGVVGLLLSIPAAFVLPAALASLACDPVVRNEKRARLAACAMAWAATLAALYLGIYGVAARNPHQQEGYEQAFLYPGAGFEGRAWLALRGTIWPSFAGIGSHIPNLPDGALVAAALVLAAGLVVLARRNGLAVGVLVALPIVLVVAASALRRYPLGVPRMMVFAAPLWILMASAAAAAIAAWLRPHARPALLVAAGLLCLAPLVKARVREAQDPPRGEDARTLVAAFRERPPRERRCTSPPAGSVLGLLHHELESPPRRLAFYALAASNGRLSRTRPAAAVPSSTRIDLVYYVRGRRASWHRHRPAVARPPTTRPRTWTRAGPPTRRVGSRARPTPARGCTSPT